MIKVVKRGITKTISNAKTKNSLDSYSLAFNSKVYLF